mmetsp:Transcript_29252/g.28347  ORF Transcript_29252/g.28347 Transcript_29252/m.28347 type:complete len:216 (-) Transcript_29252:1446-2093(-)
MNPDSNLPPPPEFAIEKIEKEPEEKQQIVVLHEKVYPISSSSLFILGAENPVRVALYWLITWKYFEAFILIAILVNSICLSLQDYQDPSSSRNYYLNMIGYAFSVLFALEALLKILALGFFLHKYSYLRDAWNILDFIIVVAGIVEFVAYFLNFGDPITLRSLRTLRVLRPLRSIQVIPSMKKLVVALITSLPQLLNVGIFIAFVFGLFAIVGLQ